MTITMAVSDEFFDSEFKELVGNQEELLKQAAEEVDPEEGIYAVELNVELLPM